MKWDGRANAAIVITGLLFTGWCAGRVQARSQGSMRATPMTNEFVPIDMRQAYFGACGFYGVEDDPLHGHAESKIWVRWGKRGDKKAEFSPIMSHRDDILTAIDDCMHWMQDVRKELAKGEIKGDPERKRDLAIPAGDLL